MDSTEKVLNMRARLVALRPEDEDSARALQTLASVSPLLTRLLPSDPEELDRYLSVIAQGALACRSDEARILQVHAWNAEMEAWEEVE